VALGTPAEGRVSVDVVLPVLNERGAIPWVLGRMPPGFRAIVVDNGSVDGSAEIALSLGATVVREPRPGFGSACWAGLCAATADVVSFMDCDASLDPEDLPRVASPVASGAADLVLGARRADPAAWSLPARLANRAIAAEIRRRTGLRLSDLGPMRAARREELSSLGIVDRRFGWPFEMVLRAHAAGWRIEEAPVPYRARVGKSKVTGTLGGSARTVADLVRVLR
jgi:glycosyltransferase involved in cell wall biosynthesis